MSELDLIVVGSGPAGITAALTGASHGKRVAIIEKAGRLGGTALGSAYGIWVPRNRHLRALGIEDERGPCLKLMCRHAYPERFEEAAPHCGVPPEDYALFEAYYDSASDMLDLFERETGVPSKPMLNHMRDPDTWDATRELLEARGLYRSEVMQRYMPDYHALDPFNLAPVGRYLTFGLTAADATVYYARIIRRLGFKGVCRALLQLVDPRVAYPLIRGSFGKYKEGVFGYAGSGVRISRIAKKLFRRKGIRVDLRTALLRLHFDDRRAVTGVEVRAPSGQTECLRAGNVVLATGGFNYDPQLVARYAAETPIVSSNGIPTNTGDALKAFGEVAPRLAHMGQYWLSESIYECVARDYKYDAYASHNVWYLNADSLIVVDRHGRRCYDESLPYSLRAKYYRRPDRLLTFLIFDKRCHQRCGGLFRSFGPALPYATWLRFLDPDFLIRGRDAGELTTRISERLDRYRDVLDVRLDDGFADHLVASVERYNGFARSGVDEDFGRGENLGMTAWMTGRPKDNRLPNKTMHPMDPSGGLFAVILSASCFSTKGGLGIDSHARVLDTDDRPIAGVYAAGNCSASPSNTGYVLSTIGPAMTFGYIGARHAATREVSDGE